MVSTSKFTQEEKDKARYFRFSFQPLAELAYYICSDYFSLIDEDTAPCGLDIVPIAIPKHIIVFWHDEQTPLDVQVSIDKIRHHNVDYIVEVYNEKTAYNFIIENYGHEIGDLYKNRCIHPSMQSDFFRICYLAEKGGIYMDVDIDCYGSVDKIFSYQDFSCLFLYSVGKPYCIDNDFIACKPKDRIMITILEKLQDHLTSKRKFADVWSCTGPGAVSNAILELLMEDILKDQNYIKTNLKLAHRRLATRSFDHAELDYKKDPACNWRVFKLPTQLYKL